MIVDCRLQKPVINGYLGGPAPTPNFGSSFHNNSPQYPNVAGEINSLYVIHIFKGKRRKILRGYGSGYHFCRKLPLTYEYKKIPLEYIYLR